MAKAGDILGDFELLREVGRGSMGVVFEARQRSLGRRVAVKVLTPSAGTDPVWVERFRSEANAVGRLSHPGIVSVYAVGDDAHGVPWFAMEFVEGRDLSDVLAAGPMDPREAARIVRDAALALSHAHEQGVVHRDVKPGNLMLRSDGRVAVTDFGLAKHMGSGSLTATGSLVGTPYYMSPEQAVGDRGTVGPKTDVYGLGVALYEMLTGVPPFTGENAIVLLRAITEKTPVPPGKARAGIPRDLETIVLCAMEKDPERRYPSCRALAEDLDHFLRGEDISRRRPGLLERGMRAALKNRIATGAVVAALLLVGGAWWYMRARADDREAELRQRLEGTLAEARLALSSGDADRARSLLSDLAAEERMGADTAEQVADVHPGPVGQTHTRLLVGHDPLAIDEVLDQVPDRLRDRALGVTKVTIRTDPADARLEVTRIARRGRSETITGPIVDRAVPCGVWRVRATAPGRVATTTSFALFQKNGRVEVDLRLPPETEVPADMVALGGQVVRLPDGTSADIAPLLVDRTEVTVGAYVRFLDSLPSAAERSAYVPRTWSDGRPPPGADQIPVTGVTYAMADAYAAWAGRRLPTQPELSLAAFGMATRSAGAVAALARGGARGTPNDLGASRKAPARVDRTNAYVSPTGVSDVLGNVAEWSATSPASDPWSALVVGGSFEQPLGPSVAARFAGDASPSVGFRCARSLAPPRPPRPLPPPTGIGRRLRIAADGAVAETREVVVENATDAEAVTATLAGCEGPEALSYRALGATAVGRSVEIASVESDGPRGRCLRKVTLRFAPPLAPREKVKVVLEEARTPLPGDDLLVRLGSRFLLDVDASAGVEVVLPVGSTIHRTGLARAVVGAVDGLPAVRVQATTGRLHLEADVPAARRVEGDALLAPALLDADLAILRAPDRSLWTKTLDGLAAEFHSDVLPSKEGVRARVVQWQEAYARVDVGTTPFGVDWEGERLVVRRRLERWNLEAPSGKVTSLPIAFPRMLVSWCRREGHRWVVVKETLLPMVDLSGTLRADGTWVNPAFGLTVAPPYGARLTSSLRGVADLQLGLSLSDRGVTGEVFGYLRLDPSSGIPPKTKADLARFGYTVVAEGTFSLGARKVEDLTFVSAPAGLHRATRRLVVPHGEGVVFLVASATSTRSKDDAVAALDAARSAADAFFRAVTVEGPETAPPR